MKYYITHDHTLLFWNDIQKEWQVELTITCMFEDYDSALKASVIEDLTSSTIKQWI
jgi:hypothetical protein